MADKTFTAVDYTRYWEAERKMLLEATGNALPKYLLSRGWEINELIKTPYQSADGQKFRTDVRRVAEAEINNPKADWKDRSLKAKKVVHGENQFISLSMSKNNFMLWVDYNKTPRLEITQPPRQYFLYAMQAEQKFMTDRLDRLPTHFRDFVRPFTTAQLNIDSLASDYHELEPLRQIAITNFGPELSKMMDFNSSIKLRYLAKNPTLGVAEKPGGSMMSLVNPSDETVRLRALELAKVKPDRTMLLWLNRRENIEVLKAYRGIAQQIGDKQKIELFYASRQEMVPAAAKKEMEIVQETDTLFKDSTTCQDLAHEFGFKYQRSTSEREFYVHESSPAGKVIVSFPKINPYVYRNHSNSELVGGNVNSFRQEFERLRPSAGTKTQGLDQTSSAINEITSIAAKHNLALSEEDMRKVPEEKNVQGAQLEINLSSFRVSHPD